MADINQRSTKYTCLKELSSHGNLVHMQKLDIFVQKFLAKVDIFVHGNHGIQFFAILRKNNLNRRHYRQNEKYEILTAMYCIEMTLDGTNMNIGTRTRGIKAVTGKGRTSVTQ